tara:strand:+ start:224 stop:778 length:555 start_codon:yes stop_codon:yes gene_type:complete
MKPIFTIHAGEYLVGAEIEKKFKNLRVWVPSKDTGIDLLISDSQCKKTVSLQVKFSKDFFGNIKKTEATENLKSGGWWQFDKKKIALSPAEYWVLVLYKFQTREHDFIVINPKKLLAIYEKIAPDAQKIQSYIWVTNNNHLSCWETRGLKKSAQIEISNGTYNSEERNLTPYLNNWSALEKITI